MQMWLPIVVFYSWDEPKQIIGGVGQMVLDKLSAMGKYDGYRLSTVGNAIIPLDSEALKFVLDELVNWKMRFQLYYIVI